MSFPDQLHLHQLQEDLWQWPGSRAAVMVGAGFSLNTEPLPGVTSRFPTWRQLVWAMFDELYPKSVNETPKEKQARDEQFSGINALRLASEYEATFDRRKLELLIRTKNPDSEHLPSILHTLLLQLPWKDVFTTNYDTLLERTEVPNRAYQSVITANDLTTTFSPRIVKLHGSFPSQTPFIITEEDYRTYPTRFASFVNTVQQALIENSLVLVGFSGDDPNFLEWIGWIRDQFENHHTPIYLVGPLSLNNTQRTLLNQKGVTPIDLSPVFVGSTPANRVHATSLDWFFRSLLAAKPQRPERWSESEFSSDPGPTSLPPIVGRRAEAPPEAVNLYPKSEVPVDAGSVAKVVSRWAFERKRYPGWIVAPNRMRSELWVKTRFWIQPLTAFIEEWPPADRVLVLREFNWRFEVAMVPLFPESIAPMESALEGLFPKLKSGDRLSASVDEMPFQDASHSEIVEAWLEIAFGLLREARETYNASRWETIKEKIDKVVSANSMGEDRCHYQEVLWRICNIERSEAKRVLAKWNPSTNSPLSAMWKAGLLAELDELGEARSVLRTALKSTQDALLQQSQNIELLSIEGWCIDLIFSVELGLDFTSRTALRQEFLARWDELKAWDCDPRSTKDYFNEALSRPPLTPQRSGNITVRGFSKDIDPWLPAFAYIRLFEQVGIPLRLPWLNISGDALSNACKWVDPFIGYWSSAILVRAEKAKELKKYEPMSRTRVAAMQPEIAQRLHQWGIDALTREIEALCGRIKMESAQESLLGILPEFLSRLAFKVNAHDVEKAFQLALKLHRAPGIRSHILLHETCKPWFKQIFDVATERKLLEWLPALIRTPFFNEDTHPLISQQNAWPDPMKHFLSGRGRLAAEAEVGLLTDIQVETNWLLKRTQNESGETRRRALSRLLDVCQAGLMTIKQKEDLGVLIWMNVPANDLPDLPLYYFSFLHLPHPHEIHVTARIRTKILELTPIKSASINPNGTLRVTQGNWKEQMILEAAMATKPIARLKGEAKGLIEWNQDEAKSLWLKALDWWNNDKVRLRESRIGSLFDGWSKRSILPELEYFDLFLARAVFPYMKNRNKEEWDSILDFVSEAKEKGVYLLICLPYMLLHRPEKKCKVEAAIRNGLLSGPKDAVEAGSVAVRHWVHLSSKGVVGEPDSDLLGNLIERVIFRRSEGIQTCIWQVSLLLIEQPNSISRERVQLLIASLAPWHDAIQLPIGEDVSGDFPEQERPVLRALIGMLAAALSKWLNVNKSEIGEPDEIKLWRETCDHDPLPEVKRSFGTWDNVDIGSEG